ncbi:hypothetical protein [Paenibacillus campi]|uniref:hypothetical protein n=1 Tax=Paenibacillus campi TaxID=3106031 RepID=UPI002AFE67D7|nr:hypothetical protein [Paenibacillus sp. SGZ-1014]
MMLLQSISNTDCYRLKAQQFMENLPYKQPPFDGRNWGHAWHSLCSYHGKLKPSIAYHLIRNFTEKGDKVLDPMSGVGTIPFEASLQGRIGIGNDLSELAYIVTRAKLIRPNHYEVDKVLQDLELFIALNKRQYAQDHIPYGKFGLNKTIPEYFHPDTYSEILAARSFFIDRTYDISDEEAFIFSCFLHVLHGNRPYALSRNSHPLTPYAPTGEFVYKNVLKHIKQKIELSYKKGEFAEFKNGTAILGDLFNLDHQFFEEIDVVITSPPFVNSIKFFQNNWMRLWLSGWEPHNFKEANDRFLEGKQNKSLNIYNEFFRVLHYVLKPKGKMILHLGKSEKCNMGAELSKYAATYFDFIHLGTEDVSQHEKHGISDKGNTTDHQFLFLQKK